MKLFSLTLVLLLAGVMSGSSALVRVDSSPLPKSIPPAPHGHKFLFLVDVSSSMERFEEGGRRALFDLIHTGVNGRMRIGDSYGLWAFNTRLYTGEYPMQVWDPTNRLFLATTASNYISSLKYEGRSRLDLAVQALSNVVSNVKDVNVIVISDDRAEMKGTAFDDPINEIYDDRSREMKRAARPFVTTLLARDGQFVTAQVLLAGEFVQLPERPPAPPWPPAPTPEEPKTNVTRQVHRERVSPRPDAGRAIMITKETIQKDREALLARLSADFAETKTNAAPIATEPAGPKPTPAAASQQASTPLSPPETSAASIDSIPAPQPADRPAHALPVDAPARLPGFSLTTLIPHSLEVSARAVNEPPADRSAPTNSSPALTAVITPPGSKPFSLLWIALGGGCLLLGAALFLWALSRRQPRPSIITQSMHR